MRMYRFMIVDVFTDTPLAGNQLAVFSNASGMPEELMQKLAAEMGFSETAFVLPPEAGGDVKIRVFTPSQEIVFAGHPTLGTAFALAGPLQSTTMRIETGVGIVPVMLEREGAKVVYGRMDQPIPVAKPFGPAAEELFEALGVRTSVLPVMEYDNGMRHIYVCLTTFEQVAALRPDMGWLGAVAGERYVNVFAIEKGSVKSRAFAPEFGIREDAATGSAAGPLALHLAQHGLIAWGEEIGIEQGAEIGRPSRLFAAAYGSAEGVTAVQVGGSAVVVARGEFGV